MHFTPFDKGILWDHLLDLVFGHEEVALSVIFSLTRCSCGVRHAEAETTGMLLSQVLNQRALADSRWSNDDQRLVILILERLSHLQLSISLSIVF